MNVFAIRGLKMRNATREARKTVQIIAKDGKDDKGTKEKGDKTEKQQPTSARNSQPQSNPTVTPDRKAVTKVNVWDKVGSSSVKQSWIPRRLKPDDQTRVVEIQFDMHGLKEDSNLTEQASAMNKVLENLLHWSRKMVGQNNVGIVPMFEDRATAMGQGALMHLSDIPTEFERLRVYLGHEDERKGSARKKWIKNGNNRRWKVKISIKGGYTFDQFLNIYEKHKDNSSIQSAYYPMKMATSQGEYSYTLRYLMSSSEKQIMDRVERDLSMEYDAELYIQYRNMPGIRNDIDHAWERANAEANGDRAVKFRWAPMAMCIHMDKTDKTKRDELVEKINSKYGKQDSKGQYPRFSDGSRMRFLPNAIYMNMLENVRAKKLGDVHIQIKKTAVEFKLPIKPPKLQRIFPKHQMKSLGELILAIQDARTKEPIFRHFTRRWNCDYDSIGVNVSVINKMAIKAEKVSIKLADILKEVYDEEVADWYWDSKGPTMVVQPPSLSNIKISNEDRYLNGDASNLIGGMELLKEDEEKKKQEEKWSNEREKNENSLMEAFELILDSEGDETDAQTAKGSGGKLKIADECSTLAYTRADTKDYEEDEEDLEEEEEPQKNTTTRTSQDQEPATPPEKKSTTPAPKESKEETTTKHHQSDDQNTEDKEQESDKPTETEEKPKTNQSTESQKMKGNKDKEPQEDPLKQNPKDIDETILAAVSQMDNEIKQTIDELDNIDEETEKPTQGNKTQGNKSEITQSSSEDDSVIYQGTYAPTEDDDEVEEVKNNEQDQEKKKNEELDNIPEEHVDEGIPEDVAEFRFKWGDLKTDIEHAETEYNELQIEARMATQPTELQCIDLDLKFILDQDMGFINEDESALMIRELYIGEVMSLKEEDLTMRANLSCLREDQIMELCTNEDGTIDEDCKSLLTLIPPRLILPDDWKIPHHTMSEEELWDIYFYFGDKVYTYVKDERERISKNKRRQSRRIANIKRKAARKGAASAP